MKLKCPSLFSLILKFAFGLVLFCSVHAETEDKSLRVLSYNIHRGGVVMLKQPLSQTAKAIQLAKADIVGIQETRSPRGDKLEELAKLLGWNHDMGKGSKILTRYEIVESLKSGVKVKLDSGREAYVFNLHLPSHPYQPYQLLGIRPKWHKHKFDIEFIKTEAEAIQWAKKARGRELTKLLRQIRSIPDKQAPVFVVGDFNEPSHLDWTEAAANAGRHPIKVEYPNSLAMTRAGFADAYRAIYPDEMKNPGYTWSSFYKFDDPTTHHDRIDFVYFKGKGIKLNEVKIVGENRKDADIIISPYPSDHRAVVADFKLTK
jgi:exodeoxyribonuclease-3